MKKKNYLHPFFKLIMNAFLFELFISNVNAQNTFPSSGSAGIGTTTPNASAKLEIKSTTRGFLTPRMTQSQRNAISSPATGLMIYQTDNAPGFYYYNGGWKAISSAATSGWSLTGNSGTNPSSNFIGTTDAQPLTFKVNNLKAGYIDYDVFKANTSFGFHTLLSNTTGTYNAATGYDALYSNTSGSYNTATGESTLYLNGTGTYNTATGAATLYSNGYGTSNTADGAQSLYSNTSGSYNTSLGAASMFENTTGSYNTATGLSALYNNTVGSYNTACGLYAILSNTSQVGNSAFGAYALYNNGLNSIQSYDGTANTAIGFYSLYSNNIGYNNTASGKNAMYFTTSGYNNAAYGLQALYSNMTGIGNTAIGVAADVNQGDLQNATAIGYYASSTGSNQVRLGNSDVTSIGGYANWTNISDGRVKKNIKQNVPGLAFINKLQPVTYNLNLDAADKITQKPQLKDKNGKIIQTSSGQSTARKAKEQILYTGFIAQDVEKAAKSLNYEFSGVDAAKNDKDLYGLRYAEFVVPLVKAVQELSAKNDDLQKQIDNLKMMIAPSTANNAFSKTSAVATLTDASLEQNKPNPYTNNTTIAYILPQKFINAQIIITDKSGKTLKAVNVSGSGKGSLNIDTATFASGAYNYSLFVDSKLIATRQMLLAKQ